MKNSIVLVLSLRLYVSNKSSRKGAKTQRKYISATT